MTSPTFSAQDLFRLLHGLSSITRFSKVHTLKPESVAEHTTHVALITMYIKLASGKLNELGPALIKVLVHDLEEVETGDVPRNTKYQSVEGFAALEKLAMEGFVKTMGSFPDFDFLYSEWSTAKQDIAVKTADMVSVAYKYYVEAVLLGNNSFKEILASNTLQFFLEFTDELKSLHTTGKPEGKAEIEVCLRLILYCLELFESTS